MNGNIRVTRSHEKSTRNCEFPTNEEAIIIQLRDGVSVEECVKSVGDLVNPSNVKFVCKTSNGTLCMYLTSKELVDRLTESHESIKIGNAFVKIRPAIRRFIKLVISNIRPVVPHDVVEQILGQYSIRVASGTMKFVGAGLSEPGYTHVLSFTREAYICLEDASKVPPSIPICYDDIDYLILLETEPPVCILPDRDGLVEKEYQSTSKGRENRVGDIKIKEDISKHKSCLPTSL